MHLQNGLDKDKTKSLADIVVRGEVSDFSVDDAIFFNPMGLAIFDIVIAKHFYTLAVERNIGTILED